MRRRITVIFFVLLVSVAAGAAALPQALSDVAPYRAFSASSYWNASLCPNTPRDPRSASMIAFLKADNEAPFVKLAGVQSNGGWGDPIYWAKPDDPVYEVVTTNYALPAEFKRLRIPAGAEPAATSDAEFTVYDLESGGVAHLWRARYDPISDTWSVGGGAYYYLSSNGLHGSFAESDEPRNFGHRGVSPSVHAVRWDEIQAGSIDHALKVAVNTAGRGYVFPMAGSDGSSTDPNAPPEGARIRIKQSVNLSRLNLTPAALVVARALQKYGAVVGDQSGGATMLKVENTVAEGKGWLWNGVLTVDSLKAIPFDSYEFVKLGFNPLKDSGCHAPHALSAVSDAYVTRRRPHKNFGTREQVRAGGVRKAVGLLKFTVSGVRETSQALLRLDARTAGPGIDIRRVASNSWRENRVTWADSPKRGRLVASSGPLSADSWIELDVSSAIRNAGTYSFAITTRSRVPASFDSKEASSELGAELVVTEP